MLQKVTFIVNYNMYESKRYFTHHLAKALQNKGIDTRIVDVQEKPLGAEIVKSVQRDKPDLTCSFNTLLPISENKFLWDFLEIPHLAILVDPALYSVNLTNSPYSILSCVDRFDCEAIRQQSFENVFFWPHAVEKELDYQPGQDRPYDVVFLGSCYDYESLRASWQQQNPAPINKVLDDAIDIFMADPKVPLTEALVNAWNASQLDPAEVDFMTLFFYLDNYTRGKDRVELIRAVKDAKVHVFGDLAEDGALGKFSWPHYLTSQSNVTIHPQVPFRAALDILKQSKICLNSMPFFKNGSHERVLASLACGALPITTDNIYFKEVFKEGQELVFYRSNQWDEVNATVNTFLADEKKRQAIAAEGRKKVMQEFTWDRRVDQLLQELPAIFGRIQGAE